MKAHDLVMRGRLIGDDCNGAEPLEAAIEPGARRSHLHHLSFRIVSLFFAVAVPLAAAAEPDRSQLKHLTIDDLKAIYAACNDAVLNGRIDFGTVAQCSVVYEELKERAFGGDFARLREWSRSQPSAVPVAQSTQRF
jgi:hypothetical protein